MAVKASTPIALDAFANSNWDINAAPVAVFNHETSLHDRLAYLWGLASRLSDLNYIFSTHGDPELHRVSMLLDCHVSPLLAVLEMMADDSAPGRKKP